MKIKIKEKLNKYEQSHGHIRMNIRSDEGEEKKEIIKKIKKKK